MSFTHNKPELKERRRALRRRQTKAEAILWKHLRRKQINGLRFKRQHSVGPFIIDFYCPTHRLAIEVDGEYHFNPEQIEYDRRREDYLSQYSIHFLRFSNQEVYDQLSFVLNKIQHWTS